MVPIPQEQLDYLLAYMQANLAMSTPEQIAAAVLAAMHANPPPTNTVMVNHVPLQGDGTPANPMRPA